MSNNNSSQAKDTVTPNPSSPYNGCTQVYRSSEVENDDLPNYISKIPSTDRYGNSLVGTGYTNSNIVKSGGGTMSVYNGTALDTTKVDRDYHWSLAMWNAADSAAARIRADVNLPNRAGDVQNMQVAIYVIGYMGNGGIDEGLLKRIANDKSSSSYDATKSTGIYVAASNTAALAAAFDTIASVILRLAY
jgi:hypothetical protein